MQNLIGGKHLVDNELGVLSLVRKFNAAHAYLILEYQRDEQLCVDDIHLVVKRGTENNHPPKADIVHRKNLTIDQLNEVVGNCYSVSWAVTQSEMARLRSLVVREQVRVADNAIDYHIVGNAPAAGLVGQSLQVAQSEAIREWSLQNSSGMASEYLLVNGHNCYSWAQAMVMSLGLPAPTIWSECFVKDPRKTLMEEPETHSRCSVM